MVVNKGSQILGGKLFMSFVVLCKIAAEIIITNAADSSNSSQNLTSDFKAELSLKISPTRGKS